MATKKKAAAKKAHKINFSGVDKEIKKGTGRAARVPEGDYLVKVIDHELRKTKDESGKYFNWKCQIVEPKKYKGKILYAMTSLKADALWNLRNLIFAATGKNVAGKAVNFDPESVYHKVVGAVVEDNEYEKKISSRINTFFAKDEYEESDDDEDEDDEDEDEDDDEEEDDEDEEEDEDEDLEDVEVEDI